MRDFMLSRRVGGQQQIKVAITFHTAGEEVLWPYGYTKTDVPADMTKDDHAALVVLGKRMANRNGYTPKQSSSLYVTDGDEIDWAYGSQRIWMFTFELYPSHAKVSSTKRFYPADELIGRETARNKDAILYLIERAGCRYSVIDKTRTHCGPMFEDFETPNGWKADPLDTDTATDGTWQRGNPAPTGWQAGTVPSGSRGAGDRHRAGGAAKANDLDGGITTIRSAPVTPARSDRVADVQVLPGPRQQFVVRRRLPRIRRAGGRHADARPPGAAAPRTATGPRGRPSRSRWRRGPVRPSASSSRRPTSRREHGRGGRRRRADHAPVRPGSRTRKVVPAARRRRHRDRPAVCLDEPAAIASPSPEPA